MDPRDFAKSFFSRPDVVSRPKLTGITAETDEPKQRNVDRVLEFTRQEVERIPPGKLADWFVVSQDLWCDHKSCNHTYLTRFRRWLSARFIAIAEWLEDAE